MLRDNSGPTRGSYAVEGVAKNPSVTGSTVSVMPQDQMVRTKAIGAMPKSSHFTVAKCCPNCIDFLFKVCLNR